MRNVEFQILHTGHDDGLVLSWDCCDRDRWDRHIAAAGLSTLEQSWAYGEALAAVEGCRTRRALITRTGRLLAMVQAFAKPGFLPLTPVRILRGPLWLEPELANGERQGVLGLVKRQFRLARRELLIWSPELPEGPESRALMRACGARQMVTGASTLVLELGRPVESLRAGLHGKWRNALTAAEQAGLKVRRAADRRSFTWLVEQAEAHRRRVTYFGPPAALIRALAQAASEEEVLVLTARAGRERIAGVLLFVHGRTATYSLAWSGPEGRRRRAHNLLLWRAILELRERGLRWLDLGGVNPARAPGVARFKMGLGGRVHTLSGTYI